MKLRPAHYTLAGSAVTLALTTCLPTLRQWERVNLVAKGVFVLSVLAIGCTSDPTTKEDIINQLKAIKGGTLTDLSQFFLVDDDQFWRGWESDGRQRDELEAYEHQKLIMNFFHQSVRAAATLDLQNRVDINHWSMQFGFVNDSKYEIKEEDSSLEIICRYSVRLLEETEEQLRLKVTSTLTVDVETAAATSFIYTLEPLDDFE